jgi:hypothetical protein
MTSIASFSDWAPVIYVLLGIVVLLFVIAGIVWIVEKVQEWN